MAALERTAVYTSTGPLSPTHRVERRVAHAAVASSAIRCRHTEVAVVAASHDTSIFHPLACTHIGLEVTQLERAVLVVSYRGTGSIVRERAVLGVACRVVRKVHSGILLGTLATAACGQVRGGAASVGSRPRVLSRATREASLRERAHLSFGAVVSQSCGLNSVARQRHGRWNVESERAVPKLHTLILGEGFPTIRLGVDNHLGD